MAETSLMTAMANVHYWPLAYGSVKLWGRLIECQNGYRAEHAYPQTIFFEPLGFLDQYGVEILPFDEKQADVRIGNAFKLESRCSGMSVTAGYEQEQNTNGGPRYSVMVRVKVVDHYEWTTWMTYARYSEAAAHARTGNRIVVFGSREWGELRRLRMAE